ncbi:carboxypeptidase regulatory-like domain-containing protein [Luteitalea sp. TBR-22]|uniref:TonB-dependent receptor n=1 Tax=Luteitalea sp. TBR-22 TaxID=2802971 RepID=UPI001EF3D79E|nr:carboxypeptidase regulatory-like domain-containing protein [Luteitalea sp. TBR-22]
MGKVHVGRSLQRLLAVAVLLLAGTPAFAQFERSAISGTVRDQQGGVMPGVTVTATNIASGVVDTAVSDESGFYTFSTLLPGQYNISAELQGFKKASRTGVQADAAGRQTLDFTLETGELSEEVTVVAEAARLQTDVALRKTVEAKDIEQLSFNGRNPIGVAGLKAGVSGGSFNNYGFSSLSNGGFNINGSRSDENNITVDGATAIRTRSAGAIVGVQNVDALQEVQVLTGNYMPEYGRASGGQIRFVTKSGSNRFSGNASFFYRDESLQANTWARNRSTNPVENSGPAPFDFKQYGYSVGGPILKNRLFFFGAQEWVNFFQVATNTATVPTLKMRQGDFSELLDPNNGFRAAIAIIDPLTGQPFPGNIIPANRLSANGLAILNTYPQPTPGFRQGSANLIQNSENPQDQRKDNIRLDFRPNAGNQFAYRFSRSNWVAVDAFRGSFPFARTDWERPNFTQTASWTSSIKSNWVNEFSYTFSRDDVFINVFTETGLYKRSNSGINYPYIFQEKEIVDKIPTVSISNFSEIDGGPYPAFSSGPIHTWQDVSTYVRGRHTFKAGVQFEYSGQDDFDQINVSAIPGSTNNQNGRFEFLDGRAGGTGVGVANVAMGLFSNYAELGQRNLTKWRALAVDAFVQDSWRPTAKLTVEGGFRYVYWPPWYSTTNNIATFAESAYNPAFAPTVNPANGTLSGGVRYNGMILPGEGFLGEGQQSVIANDPAVLRLFQGYDRGFSETHKNVFEPRFGATYQWNDKTVMRASLGMFHNRVTLNDSTLLGGNVPFQPQATVANGIADNPGGVGVSASNLPIGATAQDLVFKHPTSYIWSAGVQREIPFGFILDVTYVGRRGLYLQRERNINQLPLGTLYQNPGVNIAALRPYKGYGVIRLSENAGRSIYNSLQISADRRYTNGLKVGFAYTLSKSEDNGSDKRNVLWNTYDDTIFWGPSSFDRRQILNFYYIYDLPIFRDQTTLMGNLLGGWQISGATFMRSGTPFTVGQSAQDIAGVGDAGFGQPWSQTGPSSTNFQLYTGPGTEALDTSVFVRPANGTFGNSPRNAYYNPGEMQWDIALFKNFNMGGNRKLQLRAECFNFLNHPNLGGIDANPLSGTFGRITSKDGNRRDVQLGVRVLF